MKSELFAQEFIIKTPTELKIGKMKIVGFVVRIEGISKKQIIDLRRSTENVKE